MKKQFNNEKECLFISITSGSINGNSSINIFFSIPLPPPNLSFLHLSFFELSRPTFNLSSFHNLSYPISSFLLSASTHLQLPSSLTSNSLLVPTTHSPLTFLSQHTTSLPFLPRIPFISTSSSQSITPRVSQPRLFSSALLLHTRPTSSPISNVASATSSHSIFSPSLTTSSFRVVFQRSTLKIHRAGCL